LISSTFRLLPSRYRFHGITSASLRKRGPGVPLFLISYDLIKPEKDYPDLIKTLRNIGARRILLSEWMIKSLLDVSDLFDRVSIGGNMDAKDKLIVVEVNAWTASQNINMKGLEFG
jgi:hypothetical protein